MNPAPLFLVCVVAGMASAAPLPPAMYDLSRSGGGVRDRGSLSGSALMRDSATNEHGGYSLEGTVSPNLTTVSMSYTQLEGDYAPSNSIGARLDIYYRIDPLPGAPTVARVPLKITAGGYVSISGNVKGQVNSQVYGDFAGEYVYIGGTSQSIAWTGDRSSVSLEDGWAEVSRPMAPVGAELTLSIVTEGYLQTPSGMYSPILAGSGRLYAYTDPQVEIDSSYEFSEFFEVAQSMNIPEPTAGLICIGVTPMILRRRRKVA